MCACWQLQFSLSAVAATGTGTLTSEESVYAPSLSSQDEGTDRSIASSHHGERTVRSRKTQQEATVHPISRQQEEVVHSQVILPNVGGAPPNVGGGLTFPIMGGAHPKGLTLPNVGGAPTLPNQLGGNQLVNTVWTSQRVLSSQFIEIMPLAIWGVFDLDMYDLIDS